MTKVLKECIDWTSIKLNAFACIGFLMQDDVMTGLTALATLTTIGYNSLNIYKFFKKRKYEKQ